VTECWICREQPCTCPRVQLKQPYFNGKEWVWRRIDESELLIPWPPSMPATSHWDELHRYTWTSAEEAREFFDDWFSRRPRSCTCFDAPAILEANPMDFRTAKGFFETGVRLHNAVNLKLDAEHPGQYPQVSLTDAWAMWQKCVQPKHDNLILTIAIGAKYRELLSVTRPTHEAYAARIGADYIALTNPTCDDWKLEKFRASTFVDQYRQVLFLDVDVLIANDAVSIFAMCPDEAVWMQNDYPKSEAKGSTDWMQIEFNQVCRSQNLAPYPVTACFNSGVVVFSKTHNPWVRPQFDLPDTHVAEQWWVQHNANPIRDIPFPYNWQWWFADFHQGMPEAKFIHLAGCPQQERIDFSKQICAGY
jgi:hypothetical protein